MPPFIGIQGKQNKNQSSSKEEGYKSDGTYVRQRRRNKSPEKEYPANQLGLYDSQESLIPSYSGNRVARSSKRDSSPVSTTGSDYGNTGKKRRVTSEERQRQSSDEEEEIRSMARKKRSKRHISDDEEEEEELEPEKESIKKQEKEGLKEASKVNQEKNDGGKKKFVCFKDEKYIVKKAFFAPPEEAEDEEEIFCFPIGRPTLKYNVVLGYNTVYKVIQIYICIFSIYPSFYNFN